MKLTLTKNKASTTVEVNNIGTPVITFEEWTIMTGLTTTATVAGPFKWNPVFVDIPTDSIQSIVAMTPCNITYTIDSFKYSLDQRYLDSTGANILYRQANTEQVNKQTHY